MIDWTGKREVSPEDEEAHCYAAAYEIAGVIERTCDTPAQAADMLRGVMSALESSATPGTPYKGLFLIRKGVSA